MIRAGVPIVFLLLVSVGAAQPATPHPPTTAYIRGYWFDGKRFSRKTAYVVGDTLSFRRSAHVDAWVDLHGGYVVPPFGEAHNHNVEPLNDIPRLVATYMEHGIFYVKNPNSLPRDRATVAPLVNRSDSIDVIFANGGWTSTGGHPAEIPKRNIDRHRWTDADGEGGFYWTADTPGDVEHKWAAYLNQKPEFVKAYLLFAGDGHRQTNAQRYFGWKGLTTEVLQAIVERAHRAHLRVSAHIESAQDFHAAVVAGVDEINHMPGFRVDGDVDSHSIGEFELSDADAELAHRQHTVVVTTLVGATQADNPRRAEQDALNQRNLRRLLAHHVEVAIGSDSYRQDSVPEALYLAGLHAMSNATLLKLWTQTTAETIFPGRRIGRLAEGYEASFLVLERNPVEDFTNVTHITRRVKQGVPLQ
jgi:hypothetical protein